MNNSVRALTRYLWLNVGLALEQDASMGGNPYQHKKWSEEDQREKRAILRLAVAFVIAAKHHVRAEFGSDHEDFRGLFPAE